MKFYRNFMVIAIVTSIGCTSTAFSQLTTYKGKIKGIAFSYPSNWKLTEDKDFNQLTITEPKTRAWLTFTIRKTPLTLEEIFSNEFLSANRINTYDQNYRGGEITIDGNKAKWAGIFESRGWFNFNVMYVFVKNGNAYFLNGQGGNSSDGGVISEQEQTVKEIIKGFTITQ